MVSTTSCFKRISERINKNKVPLTEETIIYAGKWVTNDGTYIQLYNDGSGDIDKGNTTVSGGAAILTDSTIQIKILGIGSTYRIDKKPYEEDGKWKMVLDGFTYVKD